GGLPDPGVADSPVIQPRGPGIEVAAQRNQELQVIKPSTELGERARGRVVARQAQLQATARLGDTDQGDVAIRAHVAACFLRPEQIAVPGRASVGICDGEDDYLAGDVRHRPALTARALLAPCPDCRSPVLAGAEARWVATGSRLASAMIMVDLP